MYVCIKFHALWWCQRKRHCYYYVLAQCHYYSCAIYCMSFLFPGAGSQHGGKGGGFLRANVAVCLQWDSSLFPSCSLLHLPKPTNSTSTPSQDRCCLNHSFTKREETRTCDQRMEHFQINSLFYLIFFFLKCSIIGLNLKHAISDTKM